MLALAPWRRGPLHTVSTLPNTEAIADDGNITLLLFDSSPRGDRILESVGAQFAHERIAIHTDGLVSDVALKP